MNWHLAQVNVGVAKYAYTDPAFAEFVDNLDRINAMADNAPGFLWRYVAEDETAVGQDIFGDDDMLFNMSVWETREALMDYVYKTDHVHILRKRAEWFVQQKGPILALWWQPAGTLPTPTEAKHRLQILAQNGPTEEAFTFRQFFAAPEAVNA
ncbi:MAG: DUF3291 domain-containing protein [Woeseiaceae bacterium]